MKKIWFALCALLCMTVACTPGPAPAPEALRTVVACDFEQAVDTVFYKVRLHYNTPFQTRQDMFPMAWPQLSFTATCHLFTPQEMMLSINSEHSLSFLVYPGDSLHLTVDCAALQSGRAEDAVSFSGDHAQLNAEIQPWTAHIYPSLFTVWDARLSGEDFVSRFTSVLDSLNRELDTYAAATGMSAPARKWAARDLTFCLANTLPAAPRGQQSNFYARDFFDLTNPDNFASLMFMPHVKSYVSVVMTEARKRLGAQTAPDALAREMVQTMAALPAGMVRDAALYTFASSVIAGGNHDALYEAVPGLDMYIGLPAVRTLLADDCRQYLYSISDDMAVDDALQFKDGEVVPVQPDTLFAAWVSRRHPGQVVLLELGSAWCDACVFEQESVPALRRALGADSTRLVCVNCCVNSELDEWQTFVASGKPDMDYFYFSPQTAQQVISKYQIETFPAYFLIDAEGRIQPEQAPYPSHLDDALAAIRRLL